MKLQCDGIVKSSQYDIEKKTTKVKLFDLELGDDIDLKFPGEIKVGAGTPVSIDGVFRVYKFGSGSFISAVPERFTLKVAGKLVFNETAK